MKFYEGGEPCDLLIIGKTLHERFYALAFPQDQHEMTSLFNIALLELNERGTKDVRQHISRSDDYFIHCLSLA